MLLIGTIGVFFNKKIREGFFGRLNTSRKLDNFISSLHGTKRTIYWFHVSSHGEFLQSRSVLEGLKEVEPHIKIIVSYFSPSGYNNADDKIIDCKIYLPFDHKIKYHQNDGAGQRGYTPFGIEKAVNAKASDQKEFWHHGRANWNKKYKQIIVTEIFNIEIKNNFI